MTDTNKLNVLSKLFSKQDTFKFWLPLFTFSLFTIFALGRTGSDILVYGLWLYVSLYVLKRLSNKVFIGYLVFTLILSVTYLPVAVMYGKLTHGIAFSLFETNLQESTEFFSSIDLKIYIYILLYIVLFVYLLNINKSIKLASKRGKGFYVLCVVIAVSIVGKPISQGIKNKSLAMKYLSNFDYYPLRHLAKINDSTCEYLRNKQALKEARAIEAVWDFEDKNLKYNTYVLVIGESMRRDYMSAYGYPLDTTPFLAKTNGVVFNNFISASQNTRLALERMLFQNMAIEQSVVSNTPITLANSLDMDTYWLSNQGVYGDYDVFASTVAVRSDETYFLKGGKSSIEDHSDLELLPKFEEIMANDTQKNKLVVLHLMGSHWNFCERIDPNYGIENITGYINDDVSCYLSSYRQTDKLLENIYNTLQETEDSFSLMYLSDHGLVHKDRAVSGITLRHDIEYKEDYEVPLITISSDDSERTYINAQKSGYYFMNAFAEWFGIKEKSLALEPQFFADISHNEPTKVFNGEKVVDYESLEDDPAIIE